MPRLFHFNLCLRPLLEWLISMHHTLDSSVLSLDTFQSSLVMVLNQIRVNGSIFLSKHYVKLALCKKCRPTIHVFLNTTSQHFRIQLWPVVSSVLSAASHKKEQSQRVTRSNCSLTPQYFTMNPGGSLCQRVWVGGWGLRGFANIRASPRL